MKNSKHLNELRVFCSSRPPGSLMLIFQSSQIYIFYNENFIKSHLIWVTNKLPKIDKYLKDSRAVVEVGRLEALAHSPIGAVESAVLSRKHLPRSLPCPCPCRCCCHCCCH